VDKIKRGDFLFEDFSFIENIALKKGGGIYFSCNP
jgi:predicted outer membrane repeat protein